MDYGGGMAFLYPLYRQLGNVNPAGSAMGEFR